MWRVRRHGRHGVGASDTTAPLTFRFSPVRIAKPRWYVRCFRTDIESLAMPTHAYAASLYAIPPVVCGIAMLTLGIGTLIRERGSRVAVACFLMATIQSIWLLAYAAVYSSTVADVALWWARVAYVGVTLIPASVWYFVVVSLGLYVRYRYVVWGMWLLGAVFLIAALFTNALLGDVHLYWWGYYPLYGWLGTPFLAYFFLSMIANLGLFLREYRKAEPGTSHARRIRGLSVGLAIAYLGSVDFVAKYGFAVYPCGYVTLFVFFSICAWTIRRYRLVDITAASTANTVVNTMTDALLVIDYEGVIRLVNPAARALLGATDDGPTAHVRRRERVQRAARGCRRRGYAAQPRAHDAEPRRQCRDLQPLGVDPAGRASGCDRDRVPAARRHRREARGAGARRGERASGDREQGEERVPRQRLTRSADAVERHHRLHAAARGRRLRRDDCRASGRAPPRSPRRPGSADAGAGPPRPGAHRTREALVWPRAGRGRRARRVDARYDADSASRPAGDVRRRYRP